MSDIEIDTKVDKVEPIIVYDPLIDPVQMKVVEDALTLFFADMMNRKLPIRIEDARTRMRNVITNIRAAICEVLM
jgi:hypothetical protein